MLSHLPPLALILFFSCRYMSANNSSLDPDIIAAENPYVIAGFCVALLCKKWANTACQRTSCRTHCHLLGGYEHPLIDSVLSPILDEPLDLLPSNPNSVLHHLCWIVTTVEENLLPEPGPSHHSTAALVSCSSLSECLSAASSMNNEPVSYHQELLPLNVIQNVNHMVTVYTWTTENSRPAFYLVLRCLHLLDAKVQYYSHVHGGWVGINIDHSIKLSDGDGTILFVKAAHVEHCPALKQHLQKCFPHLDFLANLNNLHHSPCGCDDSDHPFQHAIHVFSDGEQVPLAPDLNDEEHNVAGMSSYSSWEGLDPARTLIDDITGNLLMHGDSQENAIDVEEVHLWPADFYVCEIAEGFEHCTVAVAAHKGVGKVFWQYFGLAKFILSTYYDNQCVWDHLPNLALQERL
ncbi:hypothetical protein HD554DRAFT_2329182 [Boletus coccyginus]|nr:hypothetical protein HD554DRAFT_2329182 [Boletus coccyginus]